MRCPLFFSLTLSVQRIQIEQIRSDEWFQKGYVPAGLLEYEDVNLDDFNAVFGDTEVGKVFKYYLFHYIGAS